MENEQAGAGRDGTAERVSRDQILRRQRGQGNIHFHCSADHEQDWQPYPVDQYSAICNDHTRGANLYPPGVFGLFADVVLSFSGVTFVCFLSFFAFIEAAALRSFLSSLCMRPGSHMLLGNN